MVRSLTHSWSCVLTQPHANSLEALGLYLKEAKQIYHRVICTHCVYFCIVYISQGKKPVYLPITRWLEEENTVYIENRVLFSSPKQNYAICREMNQIIDHHVKSNKTNSEKQLPGVFSCTWNLGLEVRWENGEELTSRITEGHMKRWFKCRTVRDALNAVRVHSKHLKI